MLTERRHYSKKFKLETFRIYGNGERSKVEIEHEFGITKGLLEKWKEP